MQPTVASVADFGITRLRDVTLAQRHATLRALRQVTGCSEPFDYPYPLLTRWIDPKMSLGEILRRLPHLPDAGAVAACLFLRAKPKMTFDVSPSNVARIDGRLVPLTAYVADLVRTCPSPIPKLVSYGVADLHAALAAELAAQKLPEKTQMAVYGRQSAMQYRVAHSRIGWFRRPL
jgi:hypothetical protein